MNYDAIIIGDGPGGISAAIYLKRSGLNPLILSKGNSSLLKTPEIENYYGFPEPISGRELFENGLRQAKRLNIDIVQDEVVAIDFTGEYAVTALKSTYTVPGVVIATGSARNIPLIKGIKEFEGKGVSYCAVCDGFFYRKKRIALLGSEAYAEHEAEILRPLAEAFYILTDGKSLQFQPHESDKIVTEKISCISGKERVDSVQFQSGDSIPIDGIFIALGTASSADFARKMGAEISDNRIVVNEKMATNLPGLYACGDTTGGLLQVAKAVYEGALAGTELSRYIKQRRT